MTELAGGDKVTPGAIEAWKRHLGEEIEGDSLRADLVEGTLLQAFHDTAMRGPERPALTIDDEMISHGELDRLAARAGGWLRAQGIDPENRVLLCGRNSLAFVIAYLGILRAGAIVVPADAGLTESELRYIVEDSDAACALAQGEALDRLMSIAGGDTPFRVIGALEKQSPEAPSLQQAISQGEPLEPVNANGDDVVMLAYTSGTTGRPKGVPLSHANLLSSTRGVMWAWRWNEDDVLVHALPFSHQHGLSSVHISLLSGSHAVVYSRFDPDRLCAAIESEKATVLFAVPGSSALFPALARKISALLGQDVLERYGSTESGLNVSNPYKGPRRFGSVGFPLPGTELAIVDDNSHSLPPGKDGEIVLRGPQVFSGYWDLPDATKENFYPGGWFRTGDVGRVDPDDGYLTITGRLKEMIISGGLNVYPQEVELVLEDHATVDKAAVVGVPSERWGEEVVAFVVSAQGRKVDNEELTAHARQHLSAYKCPKRFLAIDKLPRNQMGKVLRDELVQVANEEG